MAKLKTSEPQPTVIMIFRSRHVADAVRANKAGPTKSSRTA